MRDAELLQIRHQHGRVVEAEVLGELQPVSGERDDRRHYAPPMPAYTDQRGRVAGGMPPQTFSSQFAVGEGRSISPRFAIRCIALPPARHVAVSTPSSKRASLSPSIAAASGTTN